MDLTKKVYITVDGGTTNTRVAIVENGVVAGRLRIPMGAGCNLRDNQAFEQELRDAITELCACRCLRESQLTAILASGMITSELGLYCLPHRIAPAGIRLLHDGMKTISLPRISKCPFTLIPGIRSDGDTPEERDMMRGEETELIGLRELMKDRTETDENCLWVLPGSHSKLIRTDREGRITSFSTMLTGEMLAALSRSTILRDAVDLTLSHAAPDALLHGYRYASERGINEALFKTRILNNQLGATPEETYGFFLGAVLEGELRAILRSDARTVVLGGKPQLRIAMDTILRTFSNKTILTATDQEVDICTFLGMVRVYENA